MGSVLLTVVEAFSWCWGGCNDDNQLIVTGLVIVTSLSFLISLWTVNFSAKRKRQFKMPPGPRGLPFAGSLPFMDPKIPKYFATLASRYGPVFKVKLGSKFSVVVSSPATAKEVLSEKDSIFANRNPPASTFSISYGGHDMVFSDNNAEWRMLRMVWARTISSKSRLDALYDLRRLEVLHTVRNIHSKINTPINIYQQMSLATINMLTSMMWGGMVEGGVRTGEEFRQMVNKVVELLVNPNVSDLFPVLARFDIQGVERKMKRLFLWFDCFFDAIIEQRIKFNQTKGEGTRNKNEDILELLLQLKDQGDPKIPFTVTHLKALFQNIVVAGPDTISITIEWVMTEIMKHPNIMKEVHKELEKVVGRNTQVEEYHTPKLHYLNAVVKETLRLHPVGPILIPHRSSESCIVGGYTIPKDTNVHVNVWAIQRDPEIWENPLEFKPERFLSGTGKSDCSGNDFTYMPFGSGRRVCAGISLVERMLPHVLASMLHLFEWRLPEGTDLDLTEKFGIVMKKATPLIAIPVPRWIADSRDQYTKERLDAINNEFKLYRFHTKLNCAYACPKGLSTEKR